MRDDLTATNSLTPALPSHDSALIPVARIQALVASGRDEWCWHTLPDATEFHTVARLTVLRRGQDVELANVIGQEITIEHVVIHAASKVQPDGELQQFARVLLVPPHGPPVSCGAASVIQAVNQLVSDFQRPLPWQPPLRVRVHSRTTTPPNRIYWFEPLGFVDEKETS